MINLGVLDTAIAVVVVLLLLSLIVQSIQTFLKKLTRFKSKQIEVSLEKLFAQVPQPTPAPAVAGAPPVAPATPPATPKQMTSAVLDHFEKLGRDSLFGKHALESLSKTDLSKIVAAVQANDILPQGAMTEIRNFYGKVTAVETAVQALVSVQLSADAQEKLTQLRAQIAPIKAQVSQLFDQAGNLNKAAVANEILALRNLDTSAIVTIAADLQKSIEAAAAANVGNAVLQKAAADAAALAKIVADLNTSLVNATAQLKARFGALESWFDTVMQGFEERYARHMRSWSFAIGLVVAIAMNANIVQIYQRFSSDDIERQRVIARGAVIQQQYTQQIAAAPTDNQLLEKVKTDLAKNAQTYNELGFTPMTWQTWKTIWQWPLTPDLPKVLLGWIIMAFLLSLGAPFWHDALQSLFGVKNLLQQKTDQKNVEQGAGEGQTQSS
ncbi:MAG TPA: hypothetical protein VHU41_10600 [Thermoanaerobaculia bacterium]|jgi:hypothetical protein|nr:hypothetical protein [Thermoanaerobaculia bacterium]